MTYKTTAKNKAKRIIANTYNLYPFLPLKGLPWQFVENIQLETILHRSFDSKIKLSALIELCIRGVFNIDTIDSIIACDLEVKHPDDAIFYMIYYFNGYAEGPACFDDDPEAPKYFKEYEAELRNLLRPIISHLRTQRNLAMETHDEYNL